MPPATLPPATVPHRIPTQPSGGTESSVVTDVGVPPKAPSSATLAPVGSQQTEGTSIAPGEISP